ncbi:MAG: universal stress protein [Saprospiraceae bacterium]|nr:universal stress protein [Saprospiraceae bacterium]
MRNAVLMLVQPNRVDRQLIKYGFSVAKGMDLPLLLYGYAPSTSSVYAYHSNGSRPSVSEADWERWENRMHALCQRLRRRHPDLHYMLERDPAGFMELGDSGKSIVKRVKSMKPSLVIASRKSEYDWLRSLTGTLETSLSERLDCPLMLIPQEYVYRPVRRTMYLMRDHSKLKQSIRDLHFLSQVAKGVKATIALAFLTKGYEKFSMAQLSQMSKRIKDTIEFSRLFPYRLQSVGNPEEVITEIAEKSDTDLLAVPLHQRSLLSRLLAADSSRSLLLKSSIPLIAF